MKKLISGFGTGIDGRGLNVILSICNLHSLLWLFASLLIMRCLILPAASQEVQQLSGISRNIEQALIWDSEHIPTILDLIGERARIRFITTELTAGLLDTFLTFGFCFVFIAFVLLKMRLLNTRFRLMLILPAIGLVSDILETAATLSVVSSNHLNSDFLCSWICTFYVVKWIAFLMAICTPVFAYLFSKYQVFVKMSGR